LKRPDFLEYVTQKSYGTKMPRLGTTDARMALIPLAPLNEQKRIVAKLDAMLALANKLADQLQIVDDSIEPAAQSTFQALVEAPDRAARRKAWQRIEDGFEALTSDPRTIDALKQTILDLAVRGLLVPQDPRDEPTKITPQAVQFATISGSPPPCQVR
jgi:type I restriction enzyme S subunit